MNNEKSLPQRKHPRLKNYDYGQNGAYFITICTKERTPVLGTVSVGRGDHTPPSILLSETGRIVDQYIAGINTAYEWAAVEKYVIMPNHIHLLLVLDPHNDGGMKSSRPTIPTIIRSLKTMVTRQLGTSIWQNSFHEHIIRSENDYLSIWKYIDDNPAKWLEDKYYSP